MSQNNSDNSDDHYFCPLKGEDCHSRSADPRIGAHLPFAKSEGEEKYHQCECQCSDPEKSKGEESKALGGKQGVGKKVLGEGWVSHWGGHKREGCRGVVEESNKSHPILKGATDVFADSDTYEASPPADATILMRGLVTESLKPDSKPVTGKRKKNRATGEVQDVNEPAMPVAWTREIENPKGNTNRLFCTTMGAATDFKSEGLRRMVINGVFWGLGMEDKIDGKANVTPVGEYDPTFYSFNGFKKGVKPADYK